MPVILFYSQEILIRSMVACLKRNGLQLLDFKRRYLSCQKNNKNAEINQTKYKLDLKEKQRENPSRQMIKINIVGHGP
jgi:phage terminase large subunit